MLTMQEEKRYTYVQKKKFENNERFHCGKPIKEKKQQNQFSLNSNIDENNEGYGTSLFNHQHLQNLIVEEFSTQGIYSSTRSNRNHNSSEKSSRRCQNLDNANRGPPQLNNKSDEEQQQKENIQMFNDFTQLFNFLKSVKNENQVCQWSKNDVNNDSDNYLNYLILASRKDSDNFINIQMNVVVNQYFILRIEDPTFIVNNLCLNSNHYLKIGSFSYLRQTNQIIYEIKELQLKNEQQITSIIENADKNFQIIIKKLILFFKFKISNFSDTTDPRYIPSQYQEVNLNLNLNIKNKSQSANETELSKIDKNTPQFSDELQPKEQKQLNNTYEFINNNIRNQEQQETTIQSKQSMTNQKRLNQITKLNYEIPTLNDTDLIDQGGFHKIYRTSINIGPQKILSLVVKKDGNKIKLRKEIEFINKCFQNSYSKYIAQIYLIDKKYDQYLLKYYHFKSLREYLQKYKNVMSLKRKIKILLQIVKGIQHLHKKNILHLDIKPDNVLISKKGNVKICDFGEAYHPEYPFQKDGVKFSVPFTAPEVIKNSEVSDKADVFSFGVLAYELLFVQLPIVQILINKQAFMFKKDYLTYFKESSFNLENSQKSNVDDGPRTIIQDLQAIILKCLSPDKDQRLDISAIYELVKNQQVQFMNQKI
ncbi:unnamed protein product (macronuclear) [Paramecium tetraurelia]|uniref:Protein kinase domain-containing protein n=1 Tax=Paramecium tetraurelia TaxID=5888 RepID=A0DF67_PARTE|nr:uncharacterized protein GSPATT00016497001 [Paramecium tetraurelia]CAK81684.1 unnamed protein product [Paramecium tetraurelia]|eukprot:XP_001449081.1 hypothetical protein (macronuclear) [Paramecium tetraurelia strain d4-2]